jgi:hypothetical protein
MSPIEQPVVSRRAGAWLAISPNPSLLPFAGVDLEEEDFSLPDEIRSSLAPGRLYLRVFRVADGSPLETVFWENVA